MKYKVNTRMVNAVKNPDNTDFPTPITPPKVLISKVPSDEIDFNLACKVSIRPNWSFSLLIVSFCIKSCSNAGEVFIRVVP